MTVPLNAGVSSTVIRNNMYILKKHGSTLFYKNKNKKTTKSNNLDYITIEKLCNEMKQLFNIKVCNK